MSGENSDTQLKFSDSSAYTIRMPEIPLNPPREWFTPPSDMPKDAGCIVENDGRIYGYLCHWGSVLMDGSSDRWKPPRSKTEYAYAHTGDTVCDDGTTIRTANLGGDAGHAPSSKRVEDLQSFYEDTSTQLARVRYGEDANGVWFAGACWPTVSELDIARLRASARSGHWAAIGDWKDLSSGRSGYELVGACLVNVPGLKYARADKAASGVLMFTPMTTKRQRDPLSLVSEFVMSATQMLKAIGLAVGAATDLPLSDRELQWDSTAAEGRVREFVTDENGDINWSRYQDAFFYYDPENSEEFGGYKLQFADVIDGELTAVWRGVAAVAAVLSGSRGGVDLPSEDVDTVKGRVSAYYSRFADEYQDDSIVPPWEGSAVSEVTQSICCSGSVEFEASAATEIPVSGVLVVENQLTEDGRLIASGGAEWRDPPLPLYAKLENTEGHTDAMLVGRIDQIWRDESDNNRILYSGVIIPESASEYGQQVLDAVASKTLKGISIDGISGPNDSYVDESDTWVMTKIVIAGATLTPMPAINDATVTIGSDDASSEEFSVSDGKDFQGDDQTSDDSGSVDDAQTATAETDSLDALRESLNSVSDRVEYLIGLVESSQMSARYEAAARRI